MSTFRTNLESKGAKRAIKAAKKRGTGAGELLVAAHKTWPDFGAARMCRAKPGKKFGWAIFVVPYDKPLPEGVVARVAVAVEEETLMLDLDRGDLAREWADDHVTGNPRYHRQSRGRLTGILHERAVKLAGVKGAIE